MKRYAKTLLVTALLLGTLLSGVRARAQYDFVDNAAINTMGVNAPWSYQIFPYQNDIYIRTYNNGNGMYDFRIAAGGDIGNFREVPTTYRALLSPPVGSEVDDRVIQWVWWDNGIQYTGNGAPDPRFNLNQAGDANNVLTQTLYVNVDTTKGQVDVYSIPKDQWQPLLQPYIQGKCSCFTRYKVIGNGYLMMRRILYVDDVYLNGAQTQFNNTYIEAWTPFNKPVFNALALSMDANGNPNWWYLANYNYPYYPAFDCTTTYGYAVVFNSPNYASNTAVAFLYGVQEPKKYVNNVGTTLGQLVFNCQEWNTGCGVQPGLMLQNFLTTGYVIDQYFVIIPSQNMNAQFASNVTSMVPQVPAPRLLPPGSRLTGELASIVSQLQANRTATGTRTDHLYPLVQSWQ